MHAFGRAFFFPMFRSSLFAVFWTASVAAAQDIDLTPLVSSVGLSDTILALEQDPPTPGRDFALGGVRFLHGIEKTLQLRYRHNANFGDLELPVLRLPLPDNPNATPFYPGLVTDLMAGVVADMDVAQTALTGATGDFGVTLDLTRVWFDINENGRADAGEPLMSAAGAALGRALPAERLNSLTIRFDSADAAWLTAYTHLLEAFGHLVLAFDPTEVIAEVNDTIDRMAELRGPDAVNQVYLFLSEEDAVDNIAVLYGAVNRPPEVAHIHAMRDNLLAMVAQNRRFWDLVAEEPDNDREWIPGAGQISALGIEMPANTKERWLAVLTDAEDILLGKQLIGHWRLGGQGGVNLAKLLQDPVPVDIVTWVQGHGLIDYMERGPLVDDANLRLFQEMFRGDALLFMVWLN